MPKSSVDRCVPPHHSLTCVANELDTVGSPNFTVDLDQEWHQAVNYIGTWKLRAARSAPGGYIKYANISGATARFSFAGRNVAWIAPTGPDRGKAEV
jgi:hypothetical protein